MSSANILKVRFSEQLGRSLIYNEKSKGPSVLPMQGRCHFNEKWLEKDAYKSWLRKDDKNSNKVFCFARNKSIDLNVIGKSAMASHMKDEAQIIRKKSSRQWEGHENISVNRNIFLGFEIKLSLKKVLEISKRVLISPWKVLEFLAWKSVRTLILTWFNLFVLLFLMLPGTNQ